MKRLSLVYGCILSGLMVAPPARALHAEPPAVTVRIAEGENSSAAGDSHSEAPSSRDSGAAANAPDAAGSASAQPAATAPGAAAAPGALPPIGTQGTTDTSNHSGAAGTDAAGAAKPDRMPAAANPALARRRQLEGKVRQLMDHFGFADTTVQDAVIEYINDEVRARQPVRERGNLLLRALNSPKKTDAQVSEALEAFRTELEADRTRREAAENALNDKIGFRTKPRLEGMLLMFGVIGDGPMMVAFNESGGQGARVNRAASEAMAAPAPVTVTGVVTDKGERWIEIKTSDDAPAERYFVRWIPDANDEGGTWDQPTITTIGTCNTGDHVTISALPGRGRRIVSIVNTP
jgi:hypothetical protein